MRSSVRTLTFSAMTAALYVLLTYLSMAFGLHQGVIQFRLSELLTVLPIFTSAAIPGLSVGCLLANLLTGAPIWDVLFGTAATLLGAIGTRLLKKYPLLASFAPVISNGLIIPLVLKYAYGIPKFYWVMVLTVAVGEVTACVLLGGLLRRFLSKHPWMISLDRKEK